MSIEVLLRGICRAGALGLAGLLVACAVAPTAAPSAPPPHATACMIIDTDAALDDFRAIAALLPHAPIAVVVATAGLSSADRGAAAVAHLVATAERPIPILVGVSSPNPPAIPWLAQARAGAERLNGFLAAAVPLAAPDDRLADDVSRLTRGCAAVDVIQIAPWSSFARYAPRLGARLARVITQGDPPASRPPGKPGFNCAYDRPACDWALDFLRPRGGPIWINIPEDRASAFEPSPDTFDLLGATGLPGTLRAAMRACPQDLVGTHLWDDAVAVYWLYPRSFVQQGAHLGPAIDAATFKHLWAEAVNGAH